MQEGSVQGLKVLSKRQHVPRILHQILDECTMTGMNESEKHDPHRPPHMAMFTTDEPLLKKNLCLQTAVEDYFSTQMKLSSLFHLSKRCKSIEANRMGLPNATL